MASFDVVSLFTNIPLEETINICLDKLYANTDKVNNITRTNLKKLITMASKKNHFMFDRKFFYQTDGVPILANIFMCNLENRALTNYLGILPTVCFLIFGSAQQSQVFFNYLNNQHQNIKFTMEEEQNNILPFLDIKITRKDDGILSTSVFHKSTYSGLYLQWSSFVPKQYKLGLVNCLLYRAWKICSDEEYFNEEINFIKKILSANGYPFNFLNSCIHKFLKSKYSTKVTDVKLKDVYLSLPYKGKQSISLRRQLTKIFANIAPWVKVNMVFTANNKIGKLSKLKCKLPLIKQSQLIYQINCDDCQDFYIGMTNRRLETRLKEHRTNENSALFKHSFLTDHNINFSNPKILAKDSSSFRLQIKETLKIKEHYAYNSLNANIGSFKLNLW